MLPAIVLVVVISLLRLSGTVDSDVAWQLWIARHLHLGAHLYRDIIEINPPLWFWMAVPIDRASALLGVRSEAVVVVWIAAAVMLALIATGRVLALSKRRKTLLLAYAAAILTAYPWLHVGQREQIVLIATLPYAALIAARRDGRAVSPTLAALVGAGAALGFALKHYFLVVPALLELWLALDKQRNWRAFRPETAAIVVVGLTYACAILIWAPDFLTNVLPMIRLAYGVTGAPRFADVVQPALVLSLTMTGLMLVYWQLLRRRQSGYSAALLIAAIGFGIAYFVQHKGWAYHAIPLLGCASLALAALLAGVGSRYRPLRILAPPFLCLPLLFAWQEAIHEPMPTPDLRRAVAGLNPGDTVGFLAEETAIPWSVTLQHQLRYPSRYMGFWMLRAIVADEQRQRGDPRLAAFGRQVVRETVEDFRCTPPRRLIVARPAPGTGSFDILPFFMADSDFAELMSHYRRRSPASLEVYDLQRPLPPMPAAACRPGI